MGEGRRCYTRIAGVRRGGPIREAVLRDREAARLARVSGRGLAMACATSLVVVFGCSGEGLLGVQSACPGGCTEEAFASFDLSCSPNDLMSVTASGPCAFPDASPSSHSFAAGRSVVVRSAAPGTCHVVLTFATGFTYATDVTFTSHTDSTPAGCVPCPSYIGPTEGPIEVHNPSETCVGPVDAATFAGEGDDASGAADAADTDGP
jgi:hypothetical protein